MSTTSDTGFRVRPRFNVETEMSAKRIAELIVSALKNNSASCEGRANEHYASLYLPKSEQHYWSPRLTITFEEDENGTLMRGMYGPRPAVWTLFVFIYSAIAFAILMVAIVGMSYITINKSGAILWLIPVLILAFLSLYFVAYSGQKMGRDQMITLHDFLEEAIGIRI